LTGAEWGSIFSQAEEAGIGFILLAGGEPLLRRDVLEQAAARENIIFPIFTNGALIRDSYLAAFDAHRNLIPIISMEGGEQITDARRGQGVYRRLVDAMANLRQKDILFGASITVTAENLQLVTGQPFLSDLQQKGCKAAIFVEYVPVDGQASYSALTDAERDLLAAHLVELRKESDQMILVSFPGDEKESGGCLAAGRGFFHINAHGGAEPCPFSPYSDTNLRTVSLRQALQSPLFQKLNSQHLLEKQHTGGCVLFEQEESVRQLLA
jgi:MoaA/NifB/PqqE/SkfB family radical SAM enzyme